MTSSLLALRSRVPAEQTRWREVGELQRARLRSDLVDPLGAAVLLVDEVEPCCKGDHGGSLDELACHEALWGVAQAEVTGDPASLAAPHGVGLLEVMGREAKLAEFCSTAHPRESRHAEILLVGDGSLERLGSC